MTKERMKRPKRVAESPNIQSALKELTDQNFAFDQHPSIAKTAVQGTITYVNDKRHPIETIIQMTIKGILIAKIKLPNGNLVDFHSALDDLNSICQDQIKC
jgi:hypothetical protein